MTSSSSSLRRPRAHAARQALQHVGSVRAELFNPVMRSMYRNALGNVFGQHLTLPPPAQAPRTTTPPDPLPVLFLPGAFISGKVSWHHAAQQWPHDAGQPFICDYGRGSSRLTGTLNGVAPIERSAHELRHTINRILRDTNAQQVNIVGHSTGALVALAYLHLFGARSVAKWVGIAPCLHGTLVHNLLADSQASPRNRMVRAALQAAGAPGLADITAQSPFLTQWWRDHPIAPTSVQYLTIRTNFDTSVTPVHAQQLPGATNLLLQDVCPNNLSNHRSILADDCVRTITTQFIRDHHLPSTTTGPWAACCNAHQIAGKKTPTTEHPTREEPCPLSPSAAATSSSSVSRSSAY